MQLGGNQVKSFVRIQDSANFSSILSKMGQYPFLPQESSHNLDMQSLFNLEPNVDKSADKSEETIINKVSII